MNASKIMNSGQERVEEPSIFSSDRVSMQSVYFMPMFTSDRNPFHNFILKFKYFRSGQISRSSEEMHCAMQFKKVHDTIHQSKFLLSIIPKNQNIIH